MSKISIIIPCLNEENYIEECLNSIINSDYDLKNLEVLVVDGMSEDKTRNIVTRYIEKYEFIKLIDNIKKTAPIAMNLGIKNSLGESIFIISAHAKYKKDYFTQLEQYLIELNADCVGPLLITEVKNRNKKSSSIKKALSHKFGVGNSEFRIGLDKIKEVDTVAFGCYNKKVFDKYGYYDERLTRNQDIEINKRIKNLGGKIYLIPSIECTYYARETFQKLFKNNYENGLWNILTTYYTNSFRSLSLRHFIPLLYILSLIIPTLLSLCSIYFIFVSIASFALHTCLMLYFSLKEKDNNTSILNLFLSFLTLHYSYGIGSFVGLFKVGLMKLFGNKND